MKDTSRKTVAYITNYFGTDLINHKIWLGIHNSAVRQNINCICIPANSWNTPVGFTKMGNALYALVTKDNFDGCILWGGGLTGHASPKDVDTVYNKFKSFPMINISIPRPGIPTVTINNYPGMYALCDHMIKEHGCRKIAFIRGPVTHEEAEERFRAYRDCLKANNIRLDGKLIAIGDFLEPSGKKCISILLDERKESFDAMISASDLMAFGAINELEKRGFRIGEDIKVAGFDDLDESMIQNIPLTTVRQPFEMIGHKAMELLADKMAGKPVPDVFSIDSELIVRQSCGCRNPLSFSDTVYNSCFTSSDLSMENQLRIDREDLEPEIRCHENRGKE